MINYLKTRSKILMFSLPALALFFSCTDLEIEATDSLLAPNFEGIASAEEAASQVSAMYNSINGYIGDQANLYALSEVTTDEMLVPTRGSDWGDNGIWRQLHQHSWTPDHQYITTVWNQWNELQLVASEVLDSRSASSPDSRAAASFFRALAVYVVLDNFGQVPIRDTTAPPLDDPLVLTGEEAIAFIVTDLDAAISGLPATGPSGAENVNVSKAAARYLLAKVHLNRHIFNPVMVTHWKMDILIYLEKQQIMKPYGGSTLVLVIGFGMVYTIILLHQSNQVGGMAFQPFLNSMICLKALKVMM